MLGYLSRSVCPKIAAKNILLNLLRHSPGSAKSWNPWLHFNRDDSKLSMRRFIRNLSLLWLAVPSHSRHFKKSTCKSVLTRFQGEKFILLFETPVPKQQSTLRSRCLRSRSSVVDAPSVQPESQPQFEAHSSFPLKNFSAIDVLSCLMLWIASIVHVLALVPSKERQCRGFAEARTKAHLAKWSAASLVSKNIRTLFIRGLSCTQIFALSLEGAVCHASTLLRLWITGYSLPELHVRNPICG